MDSEDRILFEEIENFVEQQKLWAYGSNVIVALSGGSDSVFLLYALQEFSKRHCLQIPALHINHCLRGYESEGDQIFCENLCDKLKIPLDIARFEIPPKSAGIEEIARNARRKVFTDIAAERRAVVALAHTQNDSVETFLFNLMRGTGIRGLVGILPKEGIIVRPLLRISREQARRFLQKRDIFWRDDGSNADLNFSRNNIRHTLVPFVRTHFGETALQNMANSAQMLYSARQSLEKITQTSFTSALLGKCNGVIALNATLALADVFTFGEMMRASLFELGIGLKDYSRTSVERVFFALARAHPHNIIDVFGGVRASLFLNALVFFVTEPYQTDTFELPFSTEVELSNELGTIEAHLLTSMPTSIRADNFTVHLRYSGERVFISPAKANMLFQPLGGVSQSLAHFIKKRALPPILRSSLPLVLFNKRIAAVMGVEISSYFKLHGNDPQILQISWTGELPNLLRNIGANGRQ